MDPVSCRTPDRFPRQAGACASGGVEDKYGKIINEIIVRKDVLSGTGMRLSRTYRQGGT
ncbi:MAG: hypothetical protein IJF98_00620 [Firmicutes bacterium]|nr:hypothetical protein [Bacillota bacterium]